MIWRPIQIGIGNFALILDAGKRYGLLEYLIQFAQSTYNAGRTIALIVAFVRFLFARAERFERCLLRWRYA